MSGVNLLISEKHAGDQNSILDSTQIGRTCLRDKKREHQKYLKKRLYLRKFTIDNVLCIEYNQLCKRLHDFLKEVDEDGSYNQ